MPFPYVARIPKHAIKTITFDGTTYGAVGALTIFTVTGRILIDRLSVYCSTLLTGAATVELGVAGNTASIIAQSTATDIDATEFWQDTTPEVGVSPAIKDLNVGLSIILTIGSTAVTAGVLEFSMYWRPLSANASVA